MNAARASGLLLHHGIWPVKGDRHASGGGE